MGYFGIKGGGNLTNTIIYLQVFLCNPTNHRIRLLCIIVSYLAPPLVMVIPLVPFLDTVDCHIHLFKSQHNQVVAYNALNLLDNPNLNPNP